MDRYQADDQFRRTLSTSDMYSRSSQDLRYLFYFYNEKRAEEEGERGSISLEEAMGDEYTIEHIWPQNPDEIPLDDSGEYPTIEQRYEDNKHRLGNLTLASKSWNSTWGNKDFQTKREEGYDKSKLWVQWELKEYDEWTTETIEGREQELIDEFILEKWDTPETRFSEINTPEEAIPELTEQESYVFRALCTQPKGAARRVIHGEAIDLEGSPFGDYNDRSERNEVGTVLSRLAGVGLAEREKHTWYPTEEALAAVSETVG